MSVRRITDLFFKLLELLVVLNLLAMVVMVFGNVIMRYAFNSGIAVSEELSRLRSHVAELDHLLADGAPAGDKRKAGSTGKRLDFLFQEMAREANTLGSKAGALSVTRAAIDLKLQIEQMREQAQNIE